MAWKRRRNLQWRRRRKNLQWIKKWRSLSQYTAKDIKITKLELYKAQRVVYVGQRSKAAINLEVYTSDPKSIPEHVDFQEGLDKLIYELAEINDKIKIVDFLIQQEEKQNG